MFYSGLFSQKREKQKHLSFNYINNLHFCKADGVQLDLLYCAIIIDDWYKFVKDEFFAVTFLKGPHNIIFIKIM